MANPEMFVDDESNFPEADSSSNRMPKHTFDQSKAHSSLSFFGDLNRLLYTTTSHHCCNPIPQYQCYALGVKVRNMKMVFNIYGTWCRVTFEKLIMKIYLFF